MSDDVVIRANDLGKAYMIGHGERSAERYLALREVLTHTIRNIRSVKPARANYGDGKRVSVEEFWALKDVNFEIKRGEVVGIVGRNGAGKSTLLKILSRITEPTQGRVEIKGRLSSLLEVGTGFHPELSGRENIFLNGAILGMRRAEIREKFDEIVAFAEVERFLDTPVKRYSSGMYVRLAFAVAAHLEPEILVVDEVLAVGDVEFRKKCLGKMQDVAGHGRTVLFVSHDMSAMRALCNTCILLRNGQLEAKGNIEAVISKYIRYNPAANSKIYPEGTPVRFVKVYQHGKRIVLDLEYAALTAEIGFPGLGFIIHDADGRPLYGHNAMLGEAALGPDWRDGGRVRAIIESPPLLDGTYNVTVQMGDHHQTYFTDPQCLVLEITGMINARYQLDARKVGAVVPICKYFFDKFTQTEIK
jgi:lipopolysaccharide transport system ATP-binding protein